MKTIITACALAATLGALNQPQAADLRVQVSGIRSNDGQVLLGLFDDAGSFLTHGLNEALPARAGTLRTLFRDLAPGTYALAVHHDEDNDGEMATNLLGIPIEGYAFSNNARGSFGPPRFRDAAFVVGPEGGFVAVDLGY